MLKSMKANAILRVMVCCVSGMISAGNASEPETKLIRTFVNGLTNELYGSSG